MDLRYRLAVVTGAGGGVGAEIAVALSRLGAAVLVVDGDLVAAERTADLVRAARVTSWVLQADVAEDHERSMVDRRARDLGGADLLVTTTGAWSSLTEGFVGALPERRGRRDGSPAVVHVDLNRDGEQLEPFTTGSQDADRTGGARVMAVVAGHANGSSPPFRDEDAVRAVVDLLAHGRPGQVVRLSGD